MIRYITRRLLWVVFVLLFITLLTYVIFFVMPPTKPEVNFAGRQPTPELLAEVKHQFGLDKPLYVQYGLFVKRIFFGDNCGWPGHGVLFTSRSCLIPIPRHRFKVTLTL